MAITEESRHKLYKALEEKIGVDHATTLMEHLPPVGWADVVTKRDLDMRLDALENRLKSDFYQALNHHTVTFVTWMLGLQAATIGIILTAIKFWG